MMKKDKRTKEKKKPKKGFLICHASIMSQYWTNVIICTFLESQHIAEFEENKFNYFKTFF